MLNIWRVTVQGDQDKWRDFCESFMSDDISLTTEDGRVVCYIRIDPDRPIDSTGSMPPFTTQAEEFGTFTKSFHSVSVRHL